VNRTATTLAAFASTVTLLAAGVATTQARLLPAAATDATAAHAAPTCADYPNQRAAQEAADTRDGDGDGYLPAIAARWPCRWQQPNRLPATCYLHPVGSRAIGLDRRSGAAAVDAEPSA
jgi:hypothetical protein